MSDFCDEKCIDPVYTPGNQIPGLDPGDRYGICSVCGKPLYPYQIVGSKKYEHE